jgi:hypothetical protein
LNLQIASNDASPSKPVLYSVFNKWFEEMNLETYYDYCLSDGTFSFDEDALVFKVGKYMLYPH